MASRINPYNCGCYDIGEWFRGPLDNPKRLAEYEEEIKQLLEQAKAGWIKMIIGTVLKEQVEVRQLLRKYGFRKTPEAKSKYNKENTQCIYYWDSNALKPKKVKESK